MRRSLVLVPLMLSLTACQSTPVVTTSTPSEQAAPPSPVPSAEPAPAPRMLEGFAASGEASFQSADVKAFALGQSQPVMVGKLGADNHYSLQVPDNVPAGTVFMLVATTGDKTVAGLAIAPSGGNVVSPGGGNVVSPGGGNVVSPGGGNVISPGGGNVISPGGGNVISPGGGNVISPGGGNVISPGGGNVISPGGGNVISPGGGNVISPGGGNVISPGGGNVISPGGGNVISPGGANLTLGSTVAVSLLHGRFDALGQAGLTVAAGVVSPGGGNVISPGGANVVSPGGANVVSAGGLNYQLLADAPANEPSLKEVLEAYIRLVASLEQAAQALPESRRRAIYQVVDADGKGAVSKDLARDLQRAIPNVSNDFVETVKIINEILRTRINDSSNTTVDDSLLGSVVFGDVTGAPVQPRRSSSGGNTPTTQIDTTPGAPVLNGSAQ